MYKKFPHKKTNKKTKKTKIKTHIKRQTKVQKTRNPILIMINQKKPPKKPKEKFTTNHHPIDEGEPLVHITLFYNI